MLRLIRAAGLPAPRTNFPVAGFTADFVWQDQRLIVEVDGHPYHSSRPAFERDHRRDIVHKNAGYEVLRFTARQLDEEPLLVIATYRPGARTVGPAARIRPTMRVLLTNDDGIEAAGLQALRSALLQVDGIELAVIAPDGNRSAMARSITTRRPLWVQEVDFEDGTHGFATDGTPVDCVRLANLGLIEGFEAELVVSGINHGSNLGDDITYSGTVAAALEAIVLGLPGIAVSQQSSARELDFRVGTGFDFTVAASFTANLVAELESAPLPAGTLLNINVPGAHPAGCRGGAARQARVPGRAVARGRERREPAAVQDLRRREPTSATRAGPTWPRWRRARSR